MVWLVIVLILVVAFGPIFWLMPTRRERRLGRLRQHAYERGMRVDMRRLPGTEIAPEQRVTAGGRPLDTTRECAAYLMPLQGRLRQLPVMRLLRDGQGSAALAGWSFEPGRRPAHPNLQPMIDVLAPILLRLPDDVLALEVESHAVAGYWREGPDTTPQRVDDLAEQLSRAAEALVDLDARFKAQSESSDI